MDKHEKTIETLKKAGWYEGRKINQEENFKFLKEKGFEIFESAQKFMEEFGELNINVEEVNKEGNRWVNSHTTCIKFVIGVLNSMHFGLEDYITEKVLPVGSLYDFGTTLYISESGKFYKSTGWVGDSAWEAFDNIINEQGTIIWGKYEEKS